MPDSLLSPARGGFLEVESGRLVVAFAVRLEPPSQGLLIGGWKLGRGVDDAQRLEDHAVPDGRVALVEPHRQPFAVQDFVVEPGSAHRLQLLGTGLASACRLERIARVLIDVGADDDRPRIVVATDDVVVDREEQSTEHDEVQQRLAQP